MQAKKLLLTASMLMAALGHKGAIAEGPEPKPLKVFILAGQSNMQGQGVVDLTGKDYNDAKGTL
ncbi:MAG: hypothetical protein JNK53_03860, partial [Phycisphaerae bacterium]|nr:hypothetical protein [Phycisphaerae bacterium]